MTGADHDRRRDADARIELAEFDGHIAAAQYDQRTRRRLQIERVVAVDIAGAAQTRHGRRRDRAAGRDDERLALRARRRRPASGRRRPTKRRRTLEDRERVDPLDPVVGETFDDLALAAHHLAEVDLRLAGAHAQDAGLANLLHEIAAGDQRLTRHAAAQDTQAAERTAVGNRDASAELARSARGRVSSRASADDDEVVVDGFGVRSAAMVHDECLLSERARPALSGGTASPRVCGHSR